MSSLSVSSMSSSEDSPLISSSTSKSKSKSKSKKKRSMRNRLFKNKAPRGYSALDSRVRPSAPPADLVFADKARPSAPPADLVFADKARHSAPSKSPKKICNLKLNNKEARENLYFLVECLTNVFTRGPNDPNFGTERGQICELVNRAADKTTNLNDPNLVAKISVYLYTQGSKNIYVKLNESMRSIFQAKGTDDVQTIYEKWREYIISILKAAQPRKQGDTTRFTLVRNQPESYNMVTKNGTTRHEDFWQSEMILSTSKEMPAPYNFLGFDTANPVVYIFRDTNMALKINHLSAVESENEYIFLPGTTFSVINTIPFKDIESMIKKDIKNILRPQAERKTASVLASTASKGDYAPYIKTEPEKYGVLKMFLDAGYLDRWLVPNRMSLDDLVNYVTKTENGVKVVDDTKVREVKDKISGELNISYDRMEGLVFYYCDVKNMDISVQKKIIKMENNYTKKTGRKSEVAFIHKLYSSVTGIETVGGISKKGKKTRRRKKIKGKKTNVRKTKGRKKTMGGGLRRGGGSRKDNRRKKTTRRHKKTNYELYKNLILNYKKV